MYKIVIADDEKIECMALNRMLKDLHLSLENLQNVSNGEELIRTARREKPDIVVVDINMPEMNGLDAIDALHEILPDLKIVIHSAYHDYEYMQHAITMGAVSYLLKPVSEGELEKALKKAIALLDAEQRSQKRGQEQCREHQRMEEALERSLMKSVVMGEAEKELYNIVCYNLSIRSADGYIAAITRLDEKTLSEAELTSCIQWLRRYSTCIGCFHHGIGYIWFFNTDNEDDDRWLSELIRRLKETWPEMSLAIGLSTKIRKFTGCTTALREASVALHMCRRDASVIWFRERQLEKIVSPFRTEFSQENQSTEKLDTEELKEKLTVIFNSNTIQKAPLTQIRLWSADFYFQYLGNVCGKRAGTIYFMDFWESLQREQTIKGIRNFILERITQALSYYASDAADDSHKTNAVGWSHSGQKEANSELSDYVNRCLIFIEKNYSRDISLEEAAEYAGVSSFYLTRLLKQETDHSFVEILTDVRICRAVDLVHDQNMTVAQIGQAVGFPNVVYFNRVFKKWTGMTVTQMRMTWNGEITNENMRDE